MSEYRENVTLNRMSPSKVIAASLGLAGFAVAVVAGLAANNATDSILTRALVALIACNLVGTMLGAAVEVVLREHATAQAAARATYRSPAFRGLTTNGGREGEDDLGSLPLGLGQPDAGQGQRMAA